MSMGQVIYDYFKYANLNGCPVSLLLCEYGSYVFFCLAFVPETIIPIGR